MTLRASRKRMGDVSLSDPIGTDGEGNDITFMDILGTEQDELEETVIRRVTLEKVHRVLEMLPSRERMVLEMRYGLPTAKCIPSMRSRRCWGYQGAMYSTATIVNDARRQAKRLRALVFFKAKSRPFIRRFDPVDNLCAKCTEVNRCPFP